MLSLLLPPSLLALTAGLVLACTTTAAFLALLPFALLKFALPFKSFRKACGELVVAIGMRWVEVNRALYRLCYPLSWELDVGGRYDPNKSYLVICNHQSWIDILILFDVLHHRAPFLRFFLKRELLWVPVIGLACWALEMPFMQRHSKNDLKQNPALKNQDLETTRHYCEKYREIPVTVVNFVEGTRFTEAKRLAMNSPYRHLLRPKSAGLRVALDAMGGQFAGIINLTIAYRPTRYPLAWSFLAGEQDRLAVHAEILALPKDLLTGDYRDDAEFRARFQTWVSALWARKDAKLDQLISGQNITIRPRTI